MFRRPELVEIAAAGASVALVGYVAATLRGAAAGLEPDTAGVVYACLVLTGLCVIGGSVLGSTARRAAALAVQFALLVAILAALEGASVTAEIVLVVLLEAHLSLRLSLARAAIADAIVLAAATALGVAYGSDPGARGTVIVFGVLFAVLAEVAVHYRERLVDMTGTVDFLRQSLENLAAANHSFVEHLGSVEEESAERERLMITRELHDSIGYAMTNIGMMMNASRYLIGVDPAKVEEYCRKTKELASATLHDTRQVLYKLRAVGTQTTHNPPIFFSRLCRDFSEATGVRTDCHAGNLPPVISDRVFTSLFRAVQVGFINALRHGNAAHISLSFWLRADELRMRIWNDTPLGTPDVGAADEGIGLRGIRERLQAVRGSLSYGTVTDGFELVVTVPRGEAVVVTD